MNRFATFPTLLGRCAIAWRSDRISGAALPGADEQNSVAAATRAAPDAIRGEPPAWVEDVISRIRRLLAGEPAGFSDVPIDFGAAAPFERRVYAETLAIPHGETRTYGSIAAALGQPGAARAVGRALGRNPVPIIVPCHRVVAADGGSGGFSAPGGVSTKLRLLGIERARRGAQPELFDTLEWAAKA